MLLAAVRDVRQERHLTRALDRDRDLPLMPPARAGDAARPDLSLLRDVAAQLVGVLVVDLLDLLLAEVAATLPDRAGGTRPLAAGLPVSVSLSSARRHQNGISSSAEPLKSSFPAVAAAAAAEELDAVGDDLHRLALAAVLRLPLTPVEASVDADRAALGEVLRATLALVAPDGDVEVVGLVAPVSLRVLLTRVDG